MTAHPYTLLDVFTGTPLSGNPLAVVGEADGLDPATMLAFARETKLSETTFVQTPTVQGADYRNRIWDMRAELPFAGHPSLGTAVAVARARGDRSVRYVQQTPAGLQPVEVEVTGDGLRAHASMLQEPAELLHEVDPAVALAAVGLDAGDGHPELPVQFVSTGVHQLIVPVRDAEVLSRPVPDWAALQRLLDPEGAIVLYLAWCDPEAGVAITRSFTPSPEMGEDPATGSAVGPLAAYLARRTGCRRIDVRQGLEMGRPSRLFAEVASDDAGGLIIRVSGDAVVVIDGTVHL